MLCLTLEAPEVVGELLGSKVVKKVLVCRRAPRSPECFLGSACVISDRKLSTDIACKAMKGTS